MYIYIVSNSLRFLFLRPRLPPHKYRCHPGDDVNHKKTSCGVILKELCLRGHTSTRRCTRDPAGQPCKICERERIVAEKGIAYRADARRRREDEREAATARLAEVRKAAVLEREKLVHEVDLLPLEGETQPTKVDAENVGAASEGIRAKLTNTPSAPVLSGAGASGTGVADERQEHKMAENGSIQEGGVGVKDHGKTSLVEEADNKSDRNPPTIVTAATTMLDTAKDTPDAGKTGAPSQTKNKNDVAY